MSARLEPCRDCGGLGYVGPCHCAICADGEGEIYIDHDDKCEARCRRCRGRCDLEICDKCGVQDRAPAFTGGGLSCYIEVYNGVCDDCATRQEGGGDADLKGLCAGDAR